MPSAVWAQGVVGDEVFFQAAAFRIPFNVPQGAQVYRAKLFVSRDQGASWKVVSDAAPEAREFTYVSNEGDGSYWFAVQTDRKSTRLNSSHEWISYAVFCLKKKKKKIK